MSTLTLDRRALEPGGDPQLAIFGNQPAFSDLLHVGRPNIGDRDRLMARISDALDRRWLTNEGPFVAEFERCLCDLLGVRHCIAICNGTVALEIMIRAADLTGEVIIPSYTFIATAHALQWQQITPVFCDIDPNSHLIDPTRIEELITPRTTGILGVHLWGRPCNVAALTEIAKRRGLKLIFDAAHALACSSNGRMIGNFGLAEVLSFHATKFVNTFEGGAIVTNDDDLAERIRLMQNFGFVAEDRVGHIGTNGKMSEISAAMGLTSLESMTGFVAANRANYVEYERGLTDIPGIRLSRHDGENQSNYQYVVIEVDEAKARLSRDELLSVLLAENVRARRYFYPGCHRMEPYKSLFPWARLHLAETEQVADRVMVLPTGSAVDHESIRKICEILGTAVQHAFAVRRRLVKHPVKRIDRPPSQFERLPAVSFDPQRIDSDVT